jgi:hypothetical protein
MCTTTNSESRSNREIHEIHDGKAAGPAREIAGTLRFAQRPGQQDRRTVL